MCTKTFPLVLMWGWAKGDALADPGARRPIGTSRNYLHWHNSPLGPHQPQRTFVGTRFCFWIKVLAIFRNSEHYWFYSTKQKNKLTTHWGSPTCFSTWFFCFCKLKPMQIFRTLGQPFLEVTSLEEREKRC
jgi:hypothetical protein